MANILDWIAAGKPLTKTWKTDRYVFTLPVSPDRTSWRCDTAAEMSASPADREAWYGAKPGCRGGYTAASGLSYSASLGGFVGGGVTATDAKKITYKPPPAPIIPPSQTSASPGISFQTGATSGLPKQAISTTTGATPMVSTRTAGSLTGLLGTGLGTLVAGPAGGAIGGSLGGLLGGLGKSKCPGPYNYNPVTGGCDPKPGAELTGRTGGTMGTAPCPSGYAYDPATMQCKRQGLVGIGERTIPGGATGYVPAGGSWTSTEAYGTTGVVPQSVASSRLVCPRGYVLYGRQPGMEVCLPKGMMPNKFRKWPKSPNPALSAQDMKTLRRIGTLQRKIRRVAGNAGFSVKKK